MEELLKMLTDISLQRMEKEGDDIAPETFGILRELEDLVCHVETVPENAHKLSVELLAIAMRRIEKEQEHGLSWDTSELLRLLRGNIGAFL